VAALLWVIYTKAPKASTERPRKKKGFGALFVGLLGVAEELRRRVVAEYGRRSIQVQLESCQSPRRCKQMDLRHDHGSIVHVVRASYSDDAPDLLACGGEHSVQVLHVVSNPHLDAIITHGYENICTERHIGDPNRIFSRRFSDNRSGMVVKNSITLVFRRVVHRVSAYFLGRSFGQSQLTIPISIPISI
jgi:hypothetical protein